MARYHEDSSLRNMKSSLQSLGLVAHSVRTRRIQFLHTSAQLSAAKLSLVAKPTGMSQPWNRPSAEPTLGWWALQNQLSSVHETQINPTMSGCACFRHGIYHVMKGELCVLLISDEHCLDQVCQQWWGDSNARRSSEVTKSPQLNVQTSNSMTRKSSVSARQQLLKV